jgi:hypothetical protein
MSTSDESMELLRKELETFDKDKLRHLLNQINMTPAKGTKPRRQGPQHGQPISFTSVTRHYECLLCGSKFKRTDKFCKDEVLSTIDKKGHIHSIRVTGKAGEVEVPAITNRCNFCYHHIQDWSRHELERRFILLMESCSFKEVADYAKKVAD